MYAIIKDTIQVYTFDEKPKFQRGVLAYPLKAFDILEGVVEVIEFEDTVKPEPTTQLKEVFRDGISNGLQVWSERNKFGTVEQEVEYLANKQEELINKKLQDGERKIELIIQDAVNVMNTKYGVKFASIHNMSMYVLVADYPLRTQCEAMINWSANLWATARANQELIMNGTMTEEEFMVLLPAAPEV